jgi:hypothetical protein
MADAELTEFQARVYTAVRAIPPGETRSYGEVATAAGNNKAARAVGTALAKNPWHYKACHTPEGTLTDDRYVPCHRVVPQGWAPDKGGGYADLHYLGERSSAGILLRRDLMSMGL